MSRELLHLVVLIDQGIEVNRSQIEHCQNMQKIIKESIVPGMDPEHVLAAGAILGWGLGSSSVYVHYNMDKLVQVIKKLGIDTEALSKTNKPIDKSPGEDVNLFVEDYVEKARQQMLALEEIKEYLLSDKFDEASLDLIYSKKGKVLLEADFEESLKSLLD